MDSLLKTDMASAYIGGVTKYMGTARQHESRALSAPLHHSQPFHHLARLLLATHVSRRQMRSITLMCLRHEMMANSLIQLIPAAINAIHRAINDETASYVIQLIGHSRSTARERFSLGTDVYLR
jgi:hypothetical protein